MPRGFQEGADDAAALPPLMPSRYGECMHQQQTWNTAQVSQHDFPSCSPHSNENDDSGTELTSTGSSELCNHSKSDQYQIWFTKVKENWKEIRYAPEELLADKKFVLEAIRSGFGGISQFLDYIQQHKKRSKKAVRLKRFASEVIFSSRAIILEAVQQNGESLEHASEEIRNDRQVVMKSVHQNGQALKFASPNLQDDELIVTTAVRSNGLALEYANKNLRNNTFVVKTAVQEAGLAIRFSSKRLLVSQDVVLAAVKQNGLAIQYVPKNFHDNNKWIVLVAIKQNIAALAYVSDLLEDKSFVLAAVRHNGKSVLQYLSDEMKNDSRILSAAAVSV